LLNGGVAFIARLKRRVANNDHRARLHVIEDFDRGDGSRRWHRFWEFEWSFDKTRWNHRRIPNERWQGDVSAETHFSQVKPITWVCERGIATDETNPSNKTHVWRHHHADLHAKATRRGVPEQARLPEPVSESAGQQTEDE
jgi:hypothetical protein